MIDCFSHRLVGWEVAEHMRTDLVADPLHAARDNAGFAGGGSLPLRSRRLELVAVASQVFADEELERLQGFPEIGRVRCSAMRAAEARASLSLLFTANVQAVFDRDLAHSRRFPANVPQWCAADSEVDGAPNPGHDPRTVPVVPAAEVEVRRDADRATVTFTYKVEYGYPPNPVLHVRRDWLTAVARPGHVVLDGKPVLEVVDRDTHGRPVAILSALISGGFDPTMHGWRAHARLCHATVSWAGDTATVTVGGLVDERQLLN